MERDKKLQEYLEKRAKDRADRKVGQDERRRFREEPPNYRNRQSRFRRSRSHEDKGKNDRFKSGENDQYKSDRRHVKEGPLLSVNEKKSTRRFTESCNDENESKKSLKENFLNQTEPESNNKNEKGEIGNEIFKNKVDYTEITVEEPPKGVKLLEQEKNIENSQTSDELSKQSILETQETLFDKDQIDEGEKTENLQMVDCTENSKDAFNFDSDEPSERKCVDEDVWASLEEGIGRSKTKGFSDASKFMEKRKAYTKKLLEQIKEKSKPNETDPCNDLKNNADTYKNEGTSNTKKVKGNSEKLELKSSSLTKKDETSGSTNEKNTEKIETKTQSKGRMDKDLKSSEKLRTSYEKSPKGFKKRNKRRRASESDPDSDRSFSRRKNRSRSRSRSRDRKRKYESRSRRRR